MNLAGRKGNPIAVPWYETEESYLAVLSMLPAVERENATTYEAFIRQTKAIEDNIRRSGNIPYRIPVDATAIKAWCDANDSPMCGESIRAFAMQELGRRMTEPAR